MSLKELFEKEELEVHTNKHNKNINLTKTDRYSEIEIMVRLKFIIGCCLAFTLIGIVFTVLYSIMFITQPLNAISPVDQKFFELIIPVATFLCGTLSGIMLSGTSKDANISGQKTNGMPYNLTRSSTQNKGNYSNLSDGQNQTPPQTMYFPPSMVDDLDLLPGQSPKMHE